MMKKIFCLMVLTAVILLAQGAYAETVSFGDTNKYWTGWSNGTGDDSQDVIGIPNFIGGQASITNGLLSNLTFNRASGTNANWNLLSAGDLFIDTGADNVWDYVVDLSSWGTSGPNVSDPAAGSYSIYSINLALNNTSGGYILSGSDNSGLWSGYYIRDRHPVAANIDLLQGANVGSAEFSGWGSDLGTQYSFDFDGLNLGSSGQFTIGWQPNCANDVVYETLRYSTTPEPATMSLLGLGIAGVLGFRRKKRVS